MKYKVKKEKPKIRIPVAVNQHAGVHTDKKKASSKNACRKKTERIRKDDF